MPRPLTPPWRRQTKRWLAGTAAALVTAGAAVAAPQYCPHLHSHTDGCLPRLENVTLSRNVAPAPPLVLESASEPPPQPEPGKENAEKSAPAVEASEEVQPASPQAAPSRKSSYPQFEHRGQIQFQLDDGGLGSPRATSGFPSSNGLGPFPADSRIFVRRFRPSFSLAMSPSFDLQTEFNIDPYNERIQILDVRLNYDLGENTYLSAGRYKVPFGWEGLRSSRATNTIERSDLTSAIYPERDVGLSLTHQEPGLGLFSLGTFLGQARSNGASNSQYDVIGRALFQINEQVKLGVSGHTGTFRLTDSDVDLPMRRLGTELQYESGPLRLEGEAIWSNGYNTMSGVDSRAFGYYAAAVYRLAEPLDLVLHYDRFDPDLDAVSATRPSNSVNARDRKVIGLNYYIDRNMLHRIMVNYEFRQQLEGSRLHTDGFRLRYQITW